jgi:hypothetical protein
MHTEFWSGNLMENVYLEDRRGCRSVTLGGILGKYIVRWEIEGTGLRLCQRADFSTKIRTYYRYLIILILSYNRRKLLQPAA